MPARDHIIPVIVVSSFAFGCSAGYTPADDEVEYGQVQEELTLPGTSLASLPGSSALSQLPDPADVVKDPLGVLQGGLPDPTDIANDIAQSLPADLANALPDPSQLTGSLPLPSLPGTGSIPTPADVLNNATSTLTTLPGGLSLPGSGSGSGSVVSSLPGISTITGTLSGGSLPTPSSLLGGSGSGSPSGLLNTLTGTGTGALPLPSIGGGSVNVPLPLTGGASLSLQCDIGAVSCDGQTCTDLTADADNCGGCANVCDPGSVCQSGVCTSSCLPLMTDCGGACVSTFVDPNNCGSCGNQCGSFSLCFNGTCLP